MEEQRKINYDHLDSLEMELMIKHIQKLKDNNMICCPLYDYIVHDGSEETIKIKLSKIIIVQVILVLKYDRLKIY